MATRGQPEAGGTEGTPSRVASDDEHAIEGEATVVGAVLSIGAYDNMGMVILPAGIVSLEAL